ncbi:hypothetical protein BKA61DRAFT_283401 [Leptodontidium sp. MPI-SDFR-AT-0119]|nr:hypothetical protein BKA61DRAFT_283401 [Leptodontidium sp. MPI-SDFR-AT-0119]
MASVSQTQPRRRVVNNAIRVVKSQSKDVTATATATTGADDDHEPKLGPLSGPGQVRLFSYYSPSLQAGEHTVTIIHDIYAPHTASTLVPVDPTKHLTLKSEQKFEVFGLRFSLPPGAVHQSYPPQGHGDHSEVLPHIVFNDAHMPWERDVSTKNPPLTTKPLSRNLTPWLALLVFTEDELKLTPDQLTAMGAGQTLPSTLPSGATSLIQSHTTLDVNMTLGNVLNLNTTSGFHCAVVDDDPENVIDRSQAVNMIFPSGDLFTSLFCSYDASWNRVLPAADKTGKIKPDLSRYKYMAHVRQVNQAQMPENSNLTGSTEDGMGEDEGVYSIIISHRSGPLNGLQHFPATPKAALPSVGSKIELPKTAIVHLVSLQSIEDNISLPFTDPTNSRVGLVSLYSWTYTVLPPVGANFIDSMRNIGAQVPSESWLRTPDFLLQSLKNNTSLDPKAVKITNRLYSRAMDGAFIVRYMPQTGEETIAFSRGALTPTLPKHPLTPFWPTESNFSTNLQIVDKHLGMTDITYSTAWELGRTLAIADRAFTAALNRLRHSLNLYATNATKKTLQGSASTSRGSSISNLKAGVKLLADIPNQLSDDSRAVDPVRLWTVSDTVGTVPPTSVRRSAETRSLFKSNVHTAMKNIASAQPTSDGDLLPFNEINVPKSPDWAIVLKWVVDKMYLYNIPAHYLISDPSHLPKESIRFFYIDPNWIDALIDGALSIGNHLENKDDIARQAFKHQLNQYFQNPLDETAHPFNPQIPVHGFLLRSGVVQAYPNIEVHAPWHPDPNAPWAEDKNIKTDPRTQVLRSDLLDKDILLCLFDRQPGSANFKSIVISQPPHQQRYTVAKNFGPSTDPDPKYFGFNEVEVEFRKVYTTTLPLADAYTPLDSRTWVEDGPAKGEKPYNLIVDEDPTKNRKIPVKALSHNNPPSIFDFECMSVIVPAFATACNNILTQEMGNFFTDTEPSSALVGLQLADTINYLHIKLADPLTPLPADMVTRFFPVPDITSGTSGSGPGAGASGAGASGPSTSGSGISVPTVTSTTVNPTSSLSARAGFKAATSPPAPASPPAPPPHITNTIRQATTSLASSTHTSSAPIPGQFFADAFQLGKAKASKADKDLPVFPNSPSRNIPLDLIFAFVPISPQVTGLQLHVVTIQIPMGTKSTDLLKTYDIGFGPGARMLSNERFNPLLSVFNQTTPIKQDWLIVSLVPRSTTQLVPLVHNPDVSFVLNQATLNGVPGKATCLIHEGYGIMDGTGFHNTTTGGNHIDIMKLAKS